MTKRAQQKATGGTRLTWSELEEVLLDAEINLNRHPVTYVEDNLQYPILPPNSMLLEIVTPRSEEYPDEDDESNWKRRQRYVTR